MTDDPTQEKNKVFAVGSCHLLPSEIIMTYDDRAIIGGAIFVGAVSPRPFLY